MNKSDESARNLLARRYQDNKETPVAFLDETYRAPEEHAGESPFYLFTAVIVEPKHMESIRAELTRIAGGDYWHTTEALQKAEGLEKVGAMLEYLSEGDEFCVIAKKTEIDASDSDLELARRECLLGLAGALTSGEPAGFAWPAVRLMILERRPVKKMYDADEYTQKLALREKIMPRNARIFQTSPKFEKLLWLPDLVSSAARKELAVGKREFIDVIRKQVHYVESQTTP